MSLLPRTAARLVPAKHVRFLSNVHFNATDAEVEELIDNSLVRYMLRKC